MLVCRFLTLEFLVSRFVLPYEFPHLCTQVSLYSQRLPAACLPVGRVGRGFVTVTLNGSF